jgi:PHS family inorganic phosphate transporter-like MFS transporter
MGIGAYPTDEQVSPSNHPHNANTFTGIGAEYPLSAVITSEWSSTSSRAPMLSSVFLMQPVGQALAQLVGLWVLLGRNSQFGIQSMQCGIDLKNQEACRKAVDGIWRIVVGSGAVPALLAIIFRFFLYDCGLYTLEVKKKPGNAFRDTQRVYGQPTREGNGMALGSPEAVRAEGMHRRPVQFTIADLGDYFIRDKNWYYLLGTASTWFFLDLSFYGFSLDNRGTLADMWATSTPANLDPSLPCWTSSLIDGQSAVPGWQTTGYPSWQTDPTKPCSTIYDVLLDQAKQYLLTVCLSSIVASVCFIFAANWFRRREWLTTSFLVLSAMFVVTGGVYYGVNHSSGAPATVVLVAVCHFLFNFGKDPPLFVARFRPNLTIQPGANTLTFLIPAEIFPTCYRCTCHGISAAAGKLGSIIAVLVVYGINSGYHSRTRQGVILVLFGSFMLIGALFSWAYLPDIQRRKQDRRLETKNLEELGEGRQRTKLNGELLTVGDRWNNLKKRRGAQSNGRATGLPDGNV